MSQAGTISELYSEADNPNSVLGAPPSAPAPVPAPVQPVAVQNQPVTIKSRMADETPDGKVRDTSMEAVTDSGRDLGFRNITDESENAPKPKPEEAKPADVPKTEQPKVEAQPVPEKLYAEKYKTPEELERAYEEAQKLIARQGQELGTARKQLQEKPPEVAKSPAQIAAEEAEKTQYLQKFVNDPIGELEKIKQQAVQQTQVALTTQQIRNDWARNNPDLVEHESRIAFEMALLAQSDPEIGRNPAALMQKATETFRQFTGKLRSEGAKEALTQETRVIPLLSNTASATSPENPSSNGKAPLTSDEAYALHMKMLKEQEQKSHRGLRR